MTTVDVLLPVRAPAPWLHLTLAGLAAQSYPDWRLLVVVHGDDNGIAELVRDSGVPAEILYAPPTMTLPEVLNLGIGHSSAEYLARLDADDIPLPDRLAVQVRFLQDHPDCVAVGSSVELIDEDGTFLGLREPPPTQAKVLSALRWKTPIVHPSMLFRREPIAQLGGYSTLAEHTEDYDLWLRAATLGWLCALPQPLTQYRIHAGQVSSTKAISKEASDRVLQSRIALARARHESVLLARARHIAWNARQARRRARLSS
ncbi:MAG TPA: hypothetical protein DDY88_06230 [Actinobacteria bacterium]|nr:hypothetical protein [Actinomycetota bacterium]